MKMEKKNSPAGKRNMWAGQTHSGPSNAGATDQSPLQKPWGLGLSWNEWVSTPVLYTQKKQKAAFL